MFHVELRQFPHVARAFNLSAETLQARVVAPWASGQPVELEGRRWAPDRARLTIYEARELAPGELGMGRGWGTVTREGEDVTERLQKPARHREGDELAALKQRLISRAAEQPVPLSQALELAGGPTWRVSERLALAEQAVWELLHEERLALAGAGGIVTRDQWQALILAPAAWGPDSAVAVRTPGP